MERSIVPQASPFKGLLEGKAFLEEKMEGNIVHQSSLIAFLEGILSPNPRRLKRYWKEKTFLKEIWKGMEGNIVHRFSFTAFFGRNIVPKSSFFEALLEGKGLFEGNLEGKTTA